jgi:hypothetical protein
MSRPRQNLDWLDEELADIDFESPIMNKTVKSNDHASDHQLLLNKSFKVYSDIKYDTEKTSDCSTDDHHNESLLMLSEIRSVLASQSNVDNECATTETIDREINLSQDKGYSIVNSQHNNSVSATTIDTTITTPQQMSLTLCSGVKYQDQSIQVDMDNDIKFKLDYIREKCLHFENVNRELSMDIKLLQNKIEKDRTVFEELLKVSQEEINQHIERTKELSSKIMLLENNSGSNNCNSRNRPSNSDIREAENKKTQETTKYA